MKQIIIAVTQTRNESLKNVLVPNMAFELVRRTGDRVLVVDLDPALDTTKVLTSSSRKELREIEQDARDVTALLSGHRTSVTECAVPVREIVGTQPAEGSGRRPSFRSGLLHIVPGSEQLHQMQVTMLGWTPEQMAVLRKPLLEADYDWVLISCQSGISGLMTAGMLAADGFLTLVRASEADWDVGLDALFYTSFLISHYWRADEPFTCYGVIPTEYDTRVRNIRARRDELAATAVSDLMVEYGNEENRDAMHAYFAGMDVPMFAAGLRQVADLSGLPHRVLLWERAVQSGSSSPASQAGVRNMGAITQEFIERVRAAHGDSP